MPSRSMVLKVVTGKILETLELARGLAALRFRFGTAWKNSDREPRLFSFAVIRRLKQWGGPEASPTGQVVKDLLFLEYRLSSR